MARVAPLPEAAPPVEAAFFFGTLMHPKILRRVIGHDGQNLVVRDAILQGYSRHHVKAADYPAVIPAAQGAKILGRALSSTESCTRGSVVTGLSEADLKYLDVFEGDEYGREVVEVEAEGKQIRAWVYVWDADIGDLAPSIWSFEDFQKEKLHRWVAGDEEYAEVDRRQAMNGHIERTSAAHTFGKALREKHWRFRPGWLNMNQGSYGTCPAPVLQAFRATELEIESAPDVFIRQKIGPLTVDVRRQLAGLFGCHLAEMMLTPNATTAVDSVFRSLRWQEGDCVLFMSSIYSSCRNIIRNLCDSRPDLNLSAIEVPLDYPLSDEEVVKRVDAAIEGAKDKKIRLAIFDAISSIPAVRVPWERLVERCRRSRILSLVDGAHSLGNLKLDMHPSDPDFFIANVHKHMFCHRTVAAFYVPRRNQPMVHAFPIGGVYKPSPRSLMPTPASTLVDEWEWPGTFDPSNLCSVPPALEFRKQLGGEDAIMKYCHNLAVEGGKTIAQHLGTEILENAEGTLTTSMVNVRLPCKQPRQSEDRSKLVRAIETRSREEFNMSIHIFPYRDAMWARFSATVYLDLEDFKKGADILKTICDDLE